MRFFRHLIAVVLAVTVIVGLGMLWAHACGGIGSGSGLRPTPSREALPRLGQGKAGVIRVHSGNGFHLADTGDLIRTCVIEAVLAAVVITGSTVRRRHRRGGIATPPGRKSGMQLPPRTAARSRHVARK